MRLSHYIAGGLILLFLLSAGLLYVNPVDTSSSTVTDANRVQSFVDEETRFQGIHYHEEDGELGLAYLYSYEPISRRFAAIYIPPDINVVSSSYANVRSLRELYDGMSPSALSDELSITLDMQIPFWSVTRNDDLATMVDLVGGTRLPSPETTVNINLSGDGESEGRWMDGRMAMDYVSESYGDFGIQGLRYRHKTFFLGFLQWLNRQDHLINSPRTFDRVHSRLETNLSRPELHELTDLMRNLSAEKIKFPAVTGRISSAGDRHLSASRVKKMLPRPLKEIIRQAEPLEEIQVQVLNGAGINGLAQDLRTFLQKHPRIDVIDVGNADRYDYQTTRVIDRSNNPQAAYRVLEILKTGQYMSESSNEMLVDVTVIGGRDLRNTEFE